MQCATHINTKRVCSRGRQYALRRRGRAAPPQEQSALSRTGCAAAPDWAPPCPCPWPATGSARPDSSAAAACTAIDSTQQLEVKEQALERQSASSALQQLAQRTCMYTEAALASCSVRRRAERRPLRFQRSAEASPVAGDCHVCLCRLPGAIVQHLATCAQRAALQISDWRFRVS